MRMLHWIPVCDHHNSCQAPWRSSRNIYINNLISYRPDIHPVTTPTTSVTENKAIWYINVPQPRCLEAIIKTSRDNRSSTRVMWDWEPTAYSRSSVVAVRHTFSRKWRRLLLLFCSIKQPSASLSAILKTELDISSNSFNVVLGNISTQGSRCHLFISVTQTDFSVKCMQRNTDIQ